MIGIPLIREGLSAVVLASSGACPDVPPPQIRVLAQRQPTEINHALSLEELASLKTESDLPLQMQMLEHVETGGMMRGDIGISYSVSLAEIPSGVGDLHCIRYKDITVTMTLAPEVYIANDYDPGSCWFYEVLQHEESHVDMDVLVMEKYVERIRAGLEMAFVKPEDNIAGPITKDKIEAQKKTMGQGVTAMVDIIIRDMARERSEKQAAVDSVEGYSYIMNNCHEGGNVIYYDP